MSTLIIGLGGTGAKTLIHVKKMLMDSNQEGKLPDNVKILVIDTRVQPETLDNVGPWVGEYARRRQENYNNIQINPNSEYFWLGADLSRRCGQQEEDYITRWFDFRYFCNLPEHDKILNITDGAGMYRQIGRRGLMHYLQGGTNGALYTQINQIVMHVPENTFDVVLCGSLSGGTGAALFVDIAHLVKVIAQNNNKAANVTAMVVLPNAFLHQPHVTVDNAMHARALAAMREMVRFMKVHSEDLGFMMQYTPRSNDQQINRQTSGSPFALVYLLEKRVADNKNEINNPLDVPIDQGMAPMMATWISKLCDGTIRAAYNAALANINAVRQSNVFDGLTAAFTSTFGAYSIVLPLAAIVEKWSIQLALEALDRLVPLDKDGIPLDRLANTALENSGGDESKSDAKKHPARLFRDAVEVGTRLTPTAQMALATEVAGRQVSGFRPFFIVDELPEDLRVFESMAEEETYFVNNRAGFLGNKYKGALCQPQMQRTQKMELRANQLHEACEAEYQRLANNWQLRLNEMCLRQMEKNFIPQVIAHASQILNGSGENGIGVDLNNAMVARCGKLGWLLAYLDQQLIDLDNAITIFTLAKKSLAVKIQQWEEEGWKGGGQSYTLLEQMRRDDRKQAAYLSMRQNWLEAKRTEMLIEAELKTFGHMKDYLKQLFDQLDRYRDMLVGAQNGLRQALKAELKVIDQKRLQAANAMSKVRTMISDLRWEDEMYAQFCSPDPNLPAKINEVLLNLSWEVNPIMVSQQPQPVVRLRLNGLPTEGFAGTPLEHPIIEIGSNMNAQEPKVKNNLVRLLELTRQPFQIAWQKLSVVEYYEWKVRTDNYTSAQFGSMLISRGNVMMEKGGDRAGDPPKRTVYILVPETTQTSHFLLTALDYLKENNKADMEKSAIITHSDRTTLTYLVLDDGIEMDKTQAYINAIPYYLTQSPYSHGSEISRSTNHIFVAEKKATIFDEIRPAGNYLVSPRVTMLLEDERLLSDFMMAIALGYIKRSQKNSEQGVGVVNVMQASVTRENDILGDKTLVTEEYLLSDPDFPLYRDVAVEYLVAAETFILRRFDYKHEPLQGLRSRIRELVELELQKTVTELLPKWLAGEGTADAQTVAREPDTEQRQMRLLLEARKHIYRKLNGILGDWHPSDASRSYAAEVEFIAILKRIIQSTTRQSSGL